MNYEHIKISLLTVATGYEAMIKKLERNGYGKAYSNLIMDARQAAESCREVIKILDSHLDIKVLSQCELDMGYRWLASLDDITGFIDISEHLTTLEKEVGEMYAK